MSQTMITRHKSLPSRASLGLLLGAAALLCAAPLSLPAQEYESRVPKEYTSRQQSGFRRDVSRILRGQEELDEANKQRLKDWFQYLFDNMTVIDQLNELGDRRDDFFTRYLQVRPTDPTRAEAAHDFAVTLTLRYMQGVVDKNKNFHPAARFNAMLIIGRLNAVEPSIVGDKHVAVPLPDALVELVVAFRDKDPQIDAVRMAALLGILRHAEYDGQTKTMNPKYRSGLIDVMTRVIAGTDEPPGDRTEAGQLWIKRRAIDVLGALRDVGADGRVVELLSGILTDTDQPLSLRTTAATALSNIRIPANYSLDAEGITKALAGIASRSAHGELVKLKNLQERLASVKSSESSGGEGFSNDSFDSGFEDDSFDDSFDDGSEDDSFDDGSDDGSFDDMGGYDPYAGNLVTVDRAVREHYKLDLSRRRVAFHLAAVQKALTGTYGGDSPSRDPEEGAGRGIDELDAAKTETTRKLVDDVSKGLRRLFDSLEKPKVRGNQEPPPPEEELQTLIDNLQTSVSDLDAVAGIKAAKTPAGSGLPVPPTGSAPPGEPGPTGTPAPIGVPAPTGSPAPTGVPPAPTGVPPAPTGAPPAPTGVPPAPAAPSP
jgi:hypothetical protein